MTIIVYIRRYFVKNKWYTLLITIISIITLCNVGCGRKEYTKEEVYEDFKNQISKITSYTCTAKVEAIGNKENTTYIFLISYSFYFRSTSI